jgi:glycosyltransferase involved in cell wall biosynthesis
VTVATPFFSVIVPAHQGASVLPRSLSALAASDLARQRWELIVVDDASLDGTGDAAANWADQVVTLTGRPHGPAYARNRGAEAASGEWLVFIDADVVVHRDTLRRFVEAIEADPSMDAVFGAYDDAPPAPGFLTQYRNLLHRYVHLTSAGPADTFWAGCGAIRQSVFLEARGFDQRRYRRPQIEDIELGYRLRDRRRRIVIRPEIQCAHLKHWRFTGSLRTDLLERGIPWVMLLLERGRLGRPTSLNLRRGERAKALLVGLALLFLAAAAVMRQPFLALVAFFMLLAVVLSNLPLFTWFARQRGPLFALAVLPFNLLYYLVSGLSVVVGVTLHLLRRRPGAGPAVTADAPLEDRSRRGAR